MVHRDIIERSVDLAVVRVARGIDIRESIVARPIPKVALGRLDEDPACDLALVDR